MPRQLAHDGDAQARTGEPYLRASWSPVYGRGSFGDGGWLRFVWGWRHLVVPYMSTGAVEVEGGLASLGGYAGRWQETIQLTPNLSVHIPK